VRLLNRKESLVKFGKRLQLIRTSIDITQEQIQYATGITQSHLSRVEAGELNIGLTHISVLADFFGLEEFELLQYGNPIPDSELLRKNVSKYLKRNGVDPSIFLKKGLAHLLKDKVLPTRFMSSPKYTKEIASFIEDKFQAKFTTTAISQALENLRKRGLVEKMETDKKSKFQYRKK
jgi:transcriptional regulator with XRE-family HTH domain